jgi:hypothetical protein
VRPIRGVVSAAFREALLQPFLFSLEAVSEDLDPPNPFGKVRTDDKLDVLAPFLRLGERRMLRTVGKWIFGQHVIYIFDALFQFSRGGIVFRRRLNP